MDWLVIGYWPWWFSAFALAALTLGMWVIERRLLGVSGLYTEALRQRTAEERQLELAAPQAVDDAMLKATLAEFGPEALEAFKEAMAADPEPASGAARSASTVPQGANIAFLAMLAVGGLVATLLRGDWEVHPELGDLHASMIGGGVSGLLVLIFGGVLVGFGTRMGGGCTSGHGLSGCSRLQPGSLVTTASFLGGAAAVSFLLESLQ